MASDRPLPDPILRVRQPALPTRTLTCEPITVGVPFPAGFVRHPERIRLAGEDGTPVPVQAITTERWRDGSIRWALLDFCATADSAGERSFYIRVDDGPRPAAAPRIEVASTGDEIAVTTGPATFVVARGSAFPFSRVTVKGNDVLDGAHAPALILADADSEDEGAESNALVTGFAVEHHGEMRTTIRIDARVGGTRRRPLLDVTARVDLFAGSGAARVAITVCNPRRAAHRGGIWELGDAGAVRFRDLSLRLPLHAGGRGLCAIELDSPFAAVETDFEIYQDSSGGEAWQHQNHVTGDGIVPCAFRGYRFRTRYRDVTGNRATPAVRVLQPGAALTIAVPEFWQNFPRGIELEPGAIDVRLWPGQSATPHELQGGEQKTHRLVIAFGDDAAAQDAASWGRAPAAVAMSPEWYCATDAIPHLAPATCDADPRYRQLVDLAIDGPDSFERKREAIDEFGWRNFGDIYADHENAFAKDAAPIVSHYNNQYDAIAGFATQFMRTGDTRWSRMMTELAAHVEDIDIYHTTRDKSAFNGGLFWHTYHYVAAGRSTHRSYPRRDGVAGGGPGNEHNYATGLRLHWLLTGDPLSRDAAIGLADWVVNMDDGRKTVLRWLARSHTGLASATNTPDFHGPGRGAGNSILVLLEGHRLTTRREYLTKAEQLIRRCVHPDDDIDALNLRDVERRWSYVVFLQALARYLDYKRELREHDRMAAYARDTLVRYARWMADHERPYLDTPEILEYPTETWAAQDIRKADVFAFAAPLAGDPDRSRFLERAAFFLDASLSTLVAAPTRALTRPIVLLLSNGLVAMARRTTHVDPSVDMSSIEHDDREAFTPQKALAKKRLKQTAVAAMLLIAVVLLGAMTSCGIR